MPLTPDRRPVVRVLFALLPLAGCAETKSYSVVGQVTADEATNNLPATRVVGDQLLHMANMLKVHEVNGKVGLCMAVLYHGPEAKFAQVSVDYRYRMELTLTNAVGQAVTFNLMQVPVYPASGHSFSPSELKGVAMPCFVTELPWLMVPNRSPVRMEIAPR